MTAIEQLTVRFPDGSSTRLTAYPAAPGAPVVLVLPAMGVRAAYYAALATQLATRGHTAVLVDWRGQGGSSVRPSRSTSFGYAELVQMELPGITDAVCARFAVENVAVLGHSLGGHLGLMLAATSTRITHVVAVASGSSWYRLVPGIRSVGRFLGLRVLSAVTTTAGYLPAWFPFAGREARGVMRDWGYEARTGRWRVAGPVDYERALAESTTPALFIHFPGDPYVPEPCARHLAGKLPAAAVTWLEFEPARVGLARTHHFRWVRRPGAILDAAVEWWSADASTSGSGA